MGIAMMCVSVHIHVFFFNDTATTEIYTLSLHDALPICKQRSLSREREIASDPLALKTPIISNWRTTAVP